MLLGTSFVEDIQYTPQPYSRADPREKPRSAGNLHVGPRMIRHLPSFSVGLSTTLLGCAVPSDQAHRVQVVKAVAPTDAPDLRKMLSTICTAGHLREVSRNRKMVSICSEYKSVGSLGSCTGRVNGFRNALDPTSVLFGSFSVGGTTEALVDFDSICIPHTENEGGTLLFRFEGEWRHVASYRGERHTDCRTIPLQDGRTLALCFSRFVQHGYETGWLRSTLVSTDGRLAFQRLIPIASNDGAGHWDSCNEDEDDPKPNGALAIADVAIDKLQIEQQNGQMYVLLPVVYVEAELPRDICPSQSNSGTNSALAARSPMDWKQSKLAESQAIVRFALAENRLLPDRQSEETIRRMAEIGRNF